MPDAGRASARCCLDFRFSQLADVCAILIAFLAAADDIAGTEYAFAFIIYWPSRYGRCNISLAIELAAARAGYHDDDEAIKHDIPHVTVAQPRFPHDARGCRHDTATSAAFTGAQTISGRRRVARSMNAPARHRHSDGRP